jgi:hypothetical protein
MDSTSACGSTSDVSAAYAATMAKRSQDQNKVEGQSALRLIEASAPPPLPPDATISVRA